MQAKSLTSQLQKLQKNRQFMAILVLLFVCVLFWTAVTLITSQRTTKVDASLIKLAQPLSPTLNGELLDVVEQKRKYTAEELSQFTIYKIVSDTQQDIDRVVTIDTPSDIFNQDKKSQPNSQ